MIVPLPTAEMRHDLDEARRSLKAPPAEVTGAIVAFYMGVWPEHINWQEQVAPLYVDALSDIPADLLEQAFKICVQTCKFRPAPSEVREAVRDELWSRHRAVVLLGLALDEEALDRSRESPPNSPS